MRLLLGGYSADMAGHATGIGLLHAGDPDGVTAGGAFSRRDDAVAAPSPSWVARHPTLDVVYAALESRGEVRAYRRSGPDRWTPHGRAVAVGELVCHVAAAPDGGSLVASCWGDGRVVRMRLDAAGVPSAPVAVAAASDPYARESEPAAWEASRSSAVRAGDGDDLAAAARALREAAGAEFAHLVPGYDVPGYDVRGRDDARHGAPAYDDAGRGGPRHGDAVVDASGQPLFDRDGRPTGAGLLDLGDRRRGGASAAANDGTVAPVRTSRAHQARHLPHGLVATTDTGLDLVRFWRDTATGLRRLHDVALPLGSGPRHTVWHPSGHLYVLTELSREVFVLGADREGVWRMLSAAPISPAALDGDTGAELAVSDDGETLYAGLRGSDTIGVLRVRGAGNRLESTALVESGVRWPRHHVMVRDTLIVAGQHSDEVVSSTRDPRTGIPGRVRHRIAVPSPTCVLPVR